MSNKKKILSLMLAVLVGATSVSALAKNNNGNGNTGGSSDGTVGDTSGSGTGGSGTGISAFADRPLYLAGGRGVPGNLVLTPSVEFPTLQSLANLGSYTRDKAFVGYFDSEKCYEYSYSSTESERHFYPSSIATSRACSGVGEWSGNFLNWVTTQTIDPFRKALTGGYRVKDTATETWLEKARHAGNSNVAERSISGAEAAKATPFTDTVHFKIQGMEKSMQFYLGDGGFKSRNADDLKDYDPNESIDADDNYMATVRVKVCDANVGLESNCVQYGNNWKPEGLIQANVDSLNYSVFGYLNDNDVTRDGAVLRADQRNVSREWDPQTGIIFDNPDNANEGNSGVINYINKFGQLNTNSHKSFDPVSELYYAATRYLKGQDNVPEYSNDASEKHKDNFPVITDWSNADPVSYECQPSAILGIGDANTHRDGNLPGSSYRSSDEPALPGKVSADDTVNVTEMTNLIGVMEPGLDGTLGNGEFTGRRNTAYIAGLAYDNRINDMRPDLDGDQLVTTHWVDVMENQKLECATRNQYYLATKYGGFTLPDDYDASRTDDLPESWWTNGDTLACANNGTMKRPKNFYTAGNAEKMVESLGEAFKNIVSDAVGTSTSVTFNTATIESDTLLFGAQFNSASWTGKLFATSIQRAASGPPQIANTYAWEAGAVLDQRDLATAPRNIYTFDGTSGVEFTTSNLTSFTQAMKDDLAFGGDSDLAEKRIRYMRGESVDGMRSRISRLGDIVNSTPVYIEAPSMNWPESSAFGTDSGSHAGFAKTYENRKGVIYVGGNDGMLHAFAADTGEELFAYIPEFIASDTAQEGLHYLTDPAYTHRYYVDLSPVVSEVKTQGAGGSAAAWRSVLIGGARTGGKGIFALDITDPNDFASGASDIPMWEFTAADDSRLGYITEPPTISLADWGNGSYKWTVFLPNGYMSDTPSTGFFMLDMEGGLDGSWSEGSDYKYIEFDNATDATGLSPIRQVDLEGSDRIVDRIYAGDLKGNLWVATLGNQGWGNPYNGALFTATGGQNPQTVISTPQPITAAPLAIRYPEAVNAKKGGGNSGSTSKVMVLFGTGKYLELGDVNNTDVQSFYGVFDKTAGIDRSDLLDRTLTAGQVTVDGVDFDVRYSSGDAFDPTTHSGWYVDLIDSGERINLSAQVRGDYIFVNSLVPTTNPCDIGGEGWLMAFGLDGRTPDRTIWPKLGQPVVGYKVEGGIPNQTSFIDDYALTPLSNSEILPDEIDVGASSAATGRRSWQELYD